MSVATRNPFALLDDDSSRPASPPASKQQAPAAAPAQRDANKQQKSGPRGGKYYQRGGPPRQAGAKDSGNTNQNGVEDGAEAKKFSSRGDGRGRGSGRGRGGRGAGSGRGRTYDKHSQTGKVDTEKRIHQSWGGDDGETELKVSYEANQDVAAETSVDNSGWGATAGDGWGAPSGEPAAAPGGDEAAATGGDSGERRPRRDRDQEEDDNTLTLDQYLAQQKEKEESLLPKIEETRKINSEGWKDVKPLEKNEDEYFVGKKQQSGQKAKPKKEEKVYIEIDARFDRPARGGRGGRGGERGGRGGRGRGGRGGYSYNQSNAQGPDVDDQTAFPSLS